MDWLGLVPWFTAVEQIISGINELSLKKYNTRVSGFGYFGFFMVGQIILRHISNLCMNACCRVTPPVQNSFQQCSEMGGWKRDIFTTEQTR